LQGSRLTWIITSQTSTAAQRIAGKPSADRSGLECSSRSGSSGAYSATPPEKSNAGFCVLEFSECLEYVMATAKKESKPNTGFMKPVTPSSTLAEVVGAEPMPRTEVTKKVWEYIKKHDLQDPANRRMINADAKLEAVFEGKKQVSMFEMTKLISNHLK
jgi:upstream activation factor subunit UAF30